MKYISKSSYMAGLDCPRKLWQLLWDRQSAGPRSGISRLNMQFGIRFGELAHRLYPDAVLININIRNLKKAEEDTRRAIERGANVILEATFRYEVCRVLSDIVEKLPDGTWHLMEVKSSSRVKDQHIPDLAFQKWVMERCGYTVARCSVVFADKTGQWPDAKSLFKTEDVTDRVALAAESVPEKLAPMKRIAEARGDAPDARQYFSKICHDCEYKATVCWKGISEPTIYDIVNVRKIPLLKASDVFYVAEIPGDFKLSPTDRTHVDRINSKAIDIDDAAIQSMLGELEYPIYFLDFETVRVAVPLFDGIHPWEQVPFQYSLHIMDEDGEVRHREYLHEEHSDPSESLAARLVADVGEGGSIVVYHAQMESGVLKYLAGRFPEHADAFDSMTRRIWDLEVVFLKHYRDWRFGSRSSIKVVLPVVVPELTYEGQQISDGGEASLSWIEMLESDDFFVKQEKAAELRAYCHLDTFAMVELLRRLTDV